MPYYRALLAAFADVHGAVEFETKSAAPEAIEAGARAAAERVIAGRQPFVLFDNPKPERWPFYEVGVMCVDRISRLGKLKEEEVLVPGPELRFGLDPHLAPNRCLELVQRLAAVRKTFPDGEPIEWGANELDLLADLVDEARELVRAPPEHLDRDTPVEVTHRPVLQIGQRAIKLASTWGRIVDDTDRLPGGALSGSALWAAAGELATTGRFVHTRGAGRVTLRIPKEWVQRPARVAGASAETARERRRLRVEKLAAADGRGVPAPPSDTLGDFEPLPVNLAVAVANVLDGLRANDA